MGKDSEPTLIRKTSELIKQLNIYLNHFPKHEKYALAQRIRNNAYEIYDLIVEGEKRYFKKTSLTELDIAHERLRLELFLAYELDYFGYKDGVTDSKATSAHRYQTISKMVDELGKMIGGWIKNLKDVQKWN